MSSRTPLSPRDVSQRPDPEDAGDDEDRDPASETEGLLPEANMAGRQVPSQSKMASLITSFDGRKRDSESPAENDVALESLVATVNADNEYLRVQGHEAALERRFSPLAALGLGFSITGSWVGYLSNFGQNLKYDGPRSVVFGLLVATFVQWTITLGLSEVASAFPSTGGQYHFTYIIAPASHKKFAAFTVGWMTLYGWWVVTCSGLSLCAVWVSGMVSLWHPSFQAGQWQIYLIYLASVFLTAAPLFISPKLVPKIAQTTLFLSVSGCLVIFCMVLGLKRQTQPTSFITQKGLGTSGWGENTAWMFGVGNALNLTMLIGFCSAFPLFIVLMLGIRDIDTVLDSNLPALEVFYQITGSKSIATFMMCWVTVVNYFCLTSQWVTSGRMTWAFARDRGVPFSAFFSVVSPSRDFPLRATVLSICFCSLYGLLYLVSTTAFNSIVTGAVLYLNITYAVPQGIIATRGRSTTLPATRPFNLGLVGHVCNLLSVVLVIVFGTLLCFPPQRPVTVNNMNYTPVVLTGLWLLILAFWAVIGKRFEGPKIDWEGLKLTSCM